MKVACAPLSITISQFMHQCEFAQSDQSHSLAHRKPIKKHNKQPSGHMTPTDVVSTSIRLDDVAATLI